MALLIALQAAAEAQAGGDEGRFWQVSREGQVHAYLLGTMHLDDPQIANLGPGITDTLATSDILLVELLMTPAAVSEYQQRIWLDAQAPDIPLSAEARLSLAGILRSYGLDTRTALRLRPWALLNLVSRPPPSGKPVLDELLLNQAEGINLPAKGLGTMSELITRLESVDEEDTLVMLEDSISHHEDLLDEIGQMRRLYLAGDLEGLERLSLDGGDNQDVAERFFEKLLYERTERWLPQLLAAMEAQTVFIGVGALHLAGDRGLLHLLRENGYELLALDPDKSCAVQESCRVAATP